MPGTQFTEKHSDSHVSNVHARNIHASNSHGVLTAPWVSLACVVDLPAVTPTIAPPRLHFYSVTCTFSRPWRRLAWWCSWDSGERDAVCLLRLGHEQQRHPCLTPGDSHSWTFQPPGRQANSSEANKLGGSTDVLTWKDCTERPTSDWRPLEETEGPGKLSSPPALPDPAALCLQLLETRDTTVPDSSLTHRNSEIKHIGLYYFSPLCLKVFCYSALVKQKAFWLRKKKAFPDMA